MKALAPQPHSYHPILVRPPWTEVGTFYIYFVCFLIDNDIHTRNKLQQDNIAPEEKKSTLSETHFAKTSE